MRRRGSLSGVRAASRGEVVGLTWHLHNIEDGGENLGTVGMFPKWCFNVGFDFSYRHQLRGKAGRSHNTGHKGQKRLNRLATSAPIRGKKIEQRMRRLIGA